MKHLLVVLTCLFFFVACNSQKSDKTDGNNSAASPSATPSPILIKHAGDQTLQAPKNYKDLWYSRRDIEKKLVEFFITKDTRVTHNETDGRIHNFTYLEDGLLMKEVWEVNVGLGSSRDIQSLGVKSHVIMKKDALSADPQFKAKKDIEMIVSFEDNNFDGVPESVFESTIDNKTGKLIKTTWLISMADSKPLVWLACESSVTETTRRFKEIKLQ